MAERTRARARACTADTDAQSAAHLLNCTCSAGFCQCVRVCRAETDIQTVVHLLNTVDRLAFLQAVVHLDSTTIALQPDWLPLVAQNILRQQSAAPALLQHAPRLLALLLRGLRERLLTAGGVATAAAVAASRSLALAIAMLHEARPPSLF